jgi:hypothetical protein
MIFLFNYVFIKTVFTYVPCELHVYGTNFIDTTKYTFQLVLQLETLQTMNLWLTNFHVTCRCHAFRLQKRVIRIITGSTPRDSCRGVFKKSTLSFTNHSE